MGFCHCDDVGVLWDLLAAALRSGDGSKSLNTFAILSLTFALGEHSAVVLYPLCGVRILEEGPRDVTAVKDLLGFDA